MSPTAVVYWFVLRFYRKSLRELKRRESTRRGLIQSRISETLNGIPTIVAYRREADFANAVGSPLGIGNKSTFLRVHASAFSQIKADDNTDMYTEIWVTLRMEIRSCLR